MTVVPLRGPITIGRGKSRLDYGTLNSRAMNAIGRPLVPFDWGLEVCDPFTLHKLGFDAASETLADAWDKKRGKYKAVPTAPLTYRSE